MKLLAIDTSTEMASVALLSGEALYYEEQGSQKTHAQLLLPMIDKLMVQSGVSLSALDAVIFGCGPGSFTGLRIACSVAKGLAYVHGLDIIPVSTLDAIAWSAREQTSWGLQPLLVVLDARMREMYWSYYPDKHFQSDASVSPVESIVVPKAEPLLLAGVGIAAYWSDFSKELKDTVEATLDVYPHAVSMIHLVQKLNIKPVPLEMAGPVYVRNKVTG